jgi:hypothetical protein
MPDKRAILPVLILYLAACDSANGPSVPASPDVQSELMTLPEVTVEEASADDATDYSPLDVSGSWAQLQVVSTLADAPVIGQIQTTSSAILRWQITQGDDGALLIEQAACDLDLTTESDFTQMLIPDAFIDAIETYQKPGTLDTRVSPPRLDVPGHPEVHGAVLEDPMTDPMPTTADDPRVFDADGDGQPGLTVYVTGIIDGGLYVVQRNMATIEGATVSATRMEGLMGWSQEQVVLGSDNSILAENPMVTSVDPTPENTHFVAVRIPADWACDEILAHRDTLFE